MFDKKLVLLSLKRASWLITIIALLISLYIFGNSEGWNNPQHYLFNVVFISIIAFISCRMAIWVLAGLFGLNIDLEHNDTKKKKRNWGRMIKRVLSYLGITVFSLGVLVLGMYKYQQMPKVQREFLGLSLDHTAADIRFLKGEPVKISGADSAGLWDSTYLFDITHRGDGSYFVVFKSGNIDQIVAVNNLPYRYAIQGITIGSNIKDVENKFGKPDTIAIAKDDLRRNWFYYKYNVVVGLEKGEVDLLGIFNPETIFSNRGSLED